MTLITRIPGVTFSDASLSKLYRDPLITPGTKWLYDAGDLYSYAKQAAPTAGVDVWKSLTDTAADASIAGTIGYSNSGFNFSTTGPTDRINLPASGKAAANANGFLVILWLNWGTQTATTGSGLVAGCISSNATKQWGFTVGFNGSNGSLLLSANGSSQAQSLGNQPAGTNLQVAISMKKSVGGTFDYKLYKNGVSVYTASSSDTSILQPGQSNPIIGGAAGADFTNGDWVGRIYRAFYDDLSTTADAATLVAADYAANNARFV